jgi:hypothetical protein
MIHDDSAWIIQLGVSMQGMEYVIPQERRSMLLGDEVTGAAVPLTMHTCKGACHECKMK